MLPAVPSSATRSEAELRLFRELKKGPDEWTVLHSLGLRAHKRKPWAEADFVVIMSAGVFVVEVKGGAVERIGRRWYTNGDELAESPFDQASGAAAALHRELRNAFRDIDDGIVGSAVAFPDVDFDRNGPDIVPELVYDAGDRSRPIEHWFSRVTDYWSTKIDGAAAPRRRGLSRAARSRIVQQIAGDFSLRPSLRARLDEVEGELVRFTEQQANVMRALASNERILVTGGAGTGKTWLAVEEVLRASADGKSVLLLCHTKALAAWLRNRVGDHPLVHVEHLHGLTTRLIKAAGLWNRFSDASDDHRFRIEHPELAYEALTRLEDPPIFDVVVVDEAQDILTVPAVELLDGLLQGGIRDGMWRLFLDPRQDLMRATDVASQEALDVGRPTRFRLDLNCRNTAEIAMQTAVTSGRELEETLPVSGPKVEYLWHAGETDLRKQVRRTLKDWFERGVRPSDVVILGFRSLESTALAGGLPPGVPAQLKDTNRAAPDQRNVVRYTTVAGFKGLEAEAILVLDVGRIPPLEHATDIYVAMSRAKSLLAVGIDGRYKDSHTEMFGSLGAKLRERLIRQAR